MQNKQKLYFSLLAILFSSFVWLSGCNNDEDGGGGGLANEVSLSSASELSFLEKDTTITVTFEFTIPARSAGTATISAAVVELAHGVNYTTTPAESAGVITVDFAAGAPSFSFDIVVIDDDQDLSTNGNVTFTLTEVAGEESTIGSASVKLIIIDNEGGSITLDSEDALVFGEVVPGSESEAKEITFTAVNILSDYEATATEGFSVSATTDGTFASTVTIPATATSIFVKAAPSATAAFGGLDGTVTFGSGDAKVSVDLQVVVSGTIGVLFWAEYFNYPIDDTYPSYGETGYTGATVPASAKFRLAAPYNGSSDQAALDAKLTGLTRGDGYLDTWYMQTRTSGVALGDNPLSFTGYPGSGIGRCIKLAKDGSNQQQRASTAASNPCATESKNSAVGRRFVEDGSEIVSGNVYMSTMIKVVAVWSEEIPTMKNAILMLTGDAAFVNQNAMKLNVKDDGAGGFNFGVSKSSDDGSVVYGSTSYVLGETYAVVLKVEINEDFDGDLPNDAVSVYVFKEGDEIPTFESPSLVPEAKIDASNQDVDVHDVTTGLELFFTREVADDFSAGGAANVNVQNVEFSGIRIATSWNAMLQDASQAIADNETSDPIQSQRQGNATCSGFSGGNLGNVDL